jgi:hypothetical protein
VSVNKIRIEFLFRSLDNILWDLPVVIRDLLRDLINVESCFLELLVNGLVLRCTLGFPLVVTLFIVFFVLKIQVNIVIFRTRVIRTLKVLYIRLYLFVTCGFSGLFFQCFQCLWT